MQSRKISNKTQQQKTTKNQFNQDQQNQMNQQHPMTLRLGKEMKKKRKKT